MHALMCAERGAAFLDARLPGWWTCNRISLTKLRVDSEDDCPLAQAYGTTWITAARWFGLDMVRSLELGFNGVRFADQAGLYARAYGVRPALYGHLNTAWRQLIINRRFNQPTETLGLLVGVGAPE